jgi:hypothetical protein
MAIPFNIITGVNGAGVEAFTASFRYDALTLAVTSTSPPLGGVFTIPATTFTCDVMFNEAIDPTTAGVGNLTLSQGTVTAATVLPGNTTVRYTITGLTTEGTLTISLPASKVTDQFQNPGFTPFSGSYQVDVGMTSFPTPLTAIAPLGSMVYDRSTPGVINFAGDTDTFTLNIDAGQTIALQVSPTSAGLQPTVQLLDPTGTVLGSVVATGPGQGALLQTIPATTSGLYRVIVGSGSSTVGAYSLRTTLNAALEMEGLSAGATNNTPAAAENLDPAFLTLKTTLATAQRGGVLGLTDPSGAADYYAFSATAGQTATMAVTALTAGTVTLDLVAPDRTTVLASDPQSSTFKVPNSGGKSGWTSVQSVTGFQGDYTIHSQNVSPSSSNYAEWKIVTTSATPELFATWLVLPGNATNATYQVFQNPNNPPLLTVVVDQTRSPNDAMLFGATLAESLGRVALTNWKPGTTLSVRLLTLGANGNVVADAVFDPPAPPVVRPASAESVNRRGAMPGAAAVAMALDTIAAGWDRLVGKTPWQDTAFPTPGNRGEMNPVDGLEVFGQKDPRYIAGSGCDSFDVAVLDRVFADGRTDLALEGSLFQELSSPEPRG